MITFYHKNQQNNENITYMKIKVFYQLRCRFFYANIRPLPYETVVNDIASIFVPSCYQINDYGLVLAFYLEGR